jgi:hypothetical protein
MCRVHRTCRSRSIAGCLCVRRGCSTGCGSSLCWAVRICRGACCGLGVGRGIGKSGGIRWSFRVCRTRRPRLCRSRRARRCGCIRNSSGENGTIVKGRIYPERCNAVLRVLSVVDSVGWRIRGDRRGDSHHIWKVECTRITAKLVADECVEGLICVDRHRLTVAFKPSRRGIVVRKKSYAPQVRFRNTGRSLPCTERLWATDKKKTVGKHAQPT